jgi:hypothetical protein
MNKPTRLYPAETEAERVRRRTDALIAEMTARGFVRVQLQLLELFSEVHPEGKIVPLPTGRFIERGVGGVGENLVVHKEWWAHRDDVAAVQTLQAVLAQTTEEPDD